MLTSRAEASASCIEEVPVDTNEKVEDDDKKKFALFIMLHARNCPCGKLIVYLNSRD
ncbi:hypothetical protein DPMN_037722 [Dreissena polymorpha]|uniref:Uncharacterized protein n=1 Tax=Dreissena polymorpha TaxID=45954 RepID=A0A9D4MBH3_DREPO|nr:hypothetical protein DPMN_037722 [Dreissena polymorpha]